MCTSRKFGTERLHNIVVLFNRLDLRGMPLIYLINSKRYSPIA